MKKKSKKALFDPRCPGAKMIFYGAILLIIAGCINAYTSWVLVVGVLFKMAQSGDVFGYTFSLCAQVALAFLVAVDGINHRNHPSKSKGTIIKAFCVVAIAVVLMMQGDTTAGGNSTGVIVAAFSFAGSALMILGGFRNAKVLGGKK
jgi:hypothetical protein